MLTLLKSYIRFVLQYISLLFFKKITVSSGFSYKILGGDNAHYFVGYYDFDPYGYSENNILCHKVPLKYSKMVEPLKAEIGVLSVETGDFLSITSTCALNWQLGSRVQWYTNESILYNDIVDGFQCSKLVDTKTGNVVRQFKRPFWSVSPDKKIAASLNFTRIKNKRPGYGYNGSNIDGNDEVLTLFCLQSDDVLFQITLQQLIDEIKYEYVLDTDPYFNHIAWSPCSNKFITIFHLEETKTSPRMIYPVLIDCVSYKCTLLHSSGYFSHHIWVDAQHLLAYIDLDGEKCFCLWSELTGWHKVGASMPSLDGHPSPLTDNDNVVVDSYPNRLGRMSLYLGSTNKMSSLRKIANIMNPIAYKGPLRCDLHPRVSKDNKLVICDVPFDVGRKIMILEGELHGK